MQAHHVNICGLHYVFILRNGVIIVKYFYAIPYILYLVVLKISLDLEALLPNNVQSLADQMFLHLFILQGRVSWF